MRFAERAGATTVRLCTALVTVAVMTLAAGCAGGVRNDAPARAAAAEARAAPARENADLDPAMFDGGSARPVGLLAAPVPDGALAAYRLALNALAHGDLVEAEFELEQLMDAHPALTGPYVNAAIVYRRDGRDDEARVVLERALRIDPGHPEANNELGILLREEGDFAGAEAAYRRALERRPDYAHALYNLGVLLDLYLHRGAEALEAYEQYQAAVSVPSESVARWIIDLRRRFPAEAAGRVARGD